MILKKRFIVVIFLVCLFIPRSIWSFVLFKESPENDLAILAELNLETNKKFINKYKSQCLEALSFYPELKFVDIEFREDKIPTTMAARPILSGFFNLNYERKYEIIFNNSVTCEVPFFDLPREGQIGILGHELAHILDFEKKSFGQILLTGCFYANSFSIRDYERRIDHLALEKGFGENLYSAYKYILEESKASQAYKEFKTFCYLNPKEILNKIQSKPEP